VIFVAIILIVVVVLVPALGLFSSSIGNNPSNEKVSFNPVYKSSATAWGVSVHNVTPPNMPLSYFSVVLSVNGTAKLSGKTLTDGTIGDAHVGDMGATCTLSFMDIDGGGKLSGGDFFTFTFSVTPGSGITVELKVLRSSGSRELGSTSFTTTVSVPTVMFLPVEKISATGWKLVFGDISSSEYSLSSFSIVVFNGSVKAINCTPIVDGVIGTYNDGNNPLSVSFTDLTGNNKVNKGDCLTFTYTDPPASGISIETHLVWSADGTEIASKTFTT
jgi:hypothetical protein